LAPSRNSGKKNQTSTSEHLMVTEDSGELGKQGQQPIQQ
jgi:hypothetical protein